MDFPKADDRQASFESDVWELFHSMGLGYGTFLIAPVNGPTVWLIPPAGLDSASFYKDEEVMEELITKGLAQRESQPPQDRPASAQASYALTDKGKGLFAELDGADFLEGERCFVERVKPVKQ